MNNNFFVTSMFMRISCSNKLRAHPIEKIRWEFHHPSFHHIPSSLFAWFKS